MYRTNLLIVVAAGFAAPLAVVLLCVPDFPALSLSLLRREAAPRS